MLTDYHVHLRPDAENTTAAEYFTEANAERYRGTATERGIAELGVAEHVYRFTAALDVWQHPLWVESARDDIDRYCEFVRGSTDLKLGIEADFIPGREEQMRALLERQDWGLHRRLDPLPGRWRAGLRSLRRVNSAPQRRPRVEDLLSVAGRAGGQRDVRHPGPPRSRQALGPRSAWPEKDLRFYYDLAMERIAESGIAIELSTAGLRKPVGEIYPTAPSWRWSSTRAAHCLVQRRAPPEQLGFEYDQALELLSDVGVTEIAVFEHRNVTLAPIRAT